MQDLSTKCRICTHMQDLSAKCRISPHMQDLSHISMVTSRYCINNNNNNNNTVREDATLKQYTFKSNCRRPSCTPVHCLHVVLHGLSYLLIRSESGTIKIGRLLHMRPIFIGKTVHFPTIARELWLGWKMYCFAVQ